MKNVQALAENAAELTPEAIQRYIRPECPDDMDIWLLTMVRAFQWLTLAGLLIPRPRSRRLPCSSLPVRTGGSSRY